MCWEIPASPLPARQCSRLGKVAVPLCGVQELGCGCLTAARGKLNGRPKALTPGLRAMPSSFSPCGGQGAPPSSHNAPKLLH